MIGTRISALTAVAAMALSPLAPAQGGRIPVQVVDGRLVVACDVSSPSRRIPVNLFVEYETPCGLQLHNRAAAPLRLESRDGQPTPVKIHFPDFEVVVPKRELGDEEYFEEFTKYHSHELGENAVVGVIGAEILSQHHIVFDLGAGAIELSSPRELAPESPPQDVEGTTLTPITIHNDMVWLPVRYEDGKPAAASIGTARFDSTIDAVVAEELGRPAGNIGRLRIEDIDVSEHVALRPEEVILVHPDGVAGVLGLSFLKDFRVEVDRVNRWARLTRTSAPNYPESDFAFFEAMITEEADPVEGFLEARSDARLAREAAELLLELRLGELAEEDVVGRALKWVHDTTVEDLRATRIFDLMTELADEGHRRYVIAAGELGIESGRKDRYPNAVHNIHAKLGDVLLLEDEGKEAWKHLLSAAFGIPEDGMVNLNLGRYYESVGRYQRAFSRYVQACIKPESGPQAIEALERVQKLLPEEEVFSVELVERMIAGKVKSFGSATKFKADELNFGGRVALVEFFTNANLGDGSRGAIGGALGNQGLLSHFPPENVAFLSYHLPRPNLDPLFNELAEERVAEAGVRDPVVHLINGVHAAPGAARWRQGEAVYNECRKTIQKQLLSETAYTLQLEGRVQGDNVSGRLVVEGPEDEDLKVCIVLAESGVLFPGKSEVVGVHRMVARTALTDDFGGVTYLPDDGRMEVFFDDDLTEIAEENSDFLDDLEAAGRGMTTRMSVRIDPREVRLVAYLRNFRTGEVLQAAQIDPEGPEEN